MNGTFNFRDHAGQRGLLPAELTTARIDHAFSSSKDQLSGRYLFNDTYEAGTPIWGHDERNNLGRTQNVAASETHIFSPTADQRTARRLAPLQREPKSSAPPTSRLRRRRQDGPAAGSRLPEEYGPPSISINGPDGVYSMYDLQRQIGPRMRSNSIAPFTDTLSWQKGTPLPEIRRRSRPPRRDLRTGARSARQLQLRRHVYRQRRWPISCSAMSAATASIPTHTNTDLYNYSVALASNDDWKITPRLTLNFGLRWDYFAALQADRTTSSPNIQLKRLSCSATPSPPQTSPFGRELDAVRPEQLRPALRLCLASCRWAARRWCAAVTASTTRRRSRTPFSPWRKARRPPRAPRVNGNIVGAPNLFFNNPFAGAVDATGALQLRRQQRPVHARQLHPAVEPQRAAQAARARRAGCGLRRIKGTKLVVTYDDLNRPIQVVDPRTPGLASLNARRPNQRCTSAL